MIHKLPELPFSRNALAPIISEQTIDFHYGKHHQGYVDKLNSLVKGTPFESATLTDIVMKATGPIFNNAAQVWNHTFYWQSLTPKPMQPTGELLAALIKKFTTLEQFNEELKKAAVGQFGSGWVWLVMDGSGSLSLEATSNAGCPIQSGPSGQGEKTPLLTVDVWEHAYYLDYKNDRARYMDSLTKLLNWESAQEIFLKKR